MRKTFLLAITALVALMAASCQKEELGRVLTATIEQYEHNGNAKAYINNDNYACWENNDRVKINGNVYPISISEGEHNYTASIQGSEALVGKTLLAFYPASQVSNLTANGGTVTLPHIQNYETTTVNGVTYQKINNPMAAYCPEGSDDLKFHNLCALLKVTITPNSPTYVKGIQVKGIDNQMLCGTAPLKLNSQRRPVLGEFAKGSNSVLLNFATPTQVSDSKSFYIVVPGGTLFTNITIAVLTTDATGTTCTSYCKTGFLGESLSRNNIGAINYTFLGDQDDTFTPDWMIRYTGTAQVTPYNTSAFGNANYLSANSSFSNNSGYLLFDGPLTTIGNNAFKDCSALTTISLPATLTSIGDNAFQDCSALTGIDLSHTEVTSIGSSTFQGCDLLTTISLPATLTSIGGSAFQRCSALTNIDLSHTRVTSIGDNAFESCISLTSISLSATLTSIGESAFINCNTLTSIDLSHTGVTSIGDNAFNYCRSLTTISLPANLLSIGGYAFERYTSLEQVYCYAPDPPTLGQYVFDNNIYRIAVLYVPNESVETYRSNLNWSRYFSLILPLP